MVILLPKTDRYEDFLFLQIASLLQQMLIFLMLLINENLNLPFSQRYAGFADKNHILLKNKNVLIVFLSIFVVEFFWVLLALNMLRKHNNKWISVLFVTTTVFFLISCIYYTDSIMSNIKPKNISSLFEIRADSILAFHIFNSIVEATLFFSTTIISRSIKPSEKSKYSISTFCTLFSLVYFIFYPAKPIYVFGFVAIRIFYYNSCFFRRSDGCIFSLNSVILAMFLFLCYAFHVLDVISSMKEASLSEKLVDNFTNAFNGFINKML